MPWTRSRRANTTIAWRWSPPARWATWCAPSTTWRPIWTPAGSWRRVRRAQLTAANLAIEERRRELETIVETIPSGVVTLDGAGIVLQSNRAFAALMGRREDVGLGGEKIETLCSRRVRRGSGRRDSARATHGRGLHGD